MQIKKIVLALTTLFTPYCISSFTLMIDPAGDQNNTGRAIYDSFERGLTLQCAQELKKELELQIPHIRVILTRNPGEKFESLHNARYANKIKPDLYLRIGFYAQSSLPLNCSLYYYQVESTDIWHKNKDLFFYPLDQAYLISLHRSASIAQHFLTVLQNGTINPVFIVQGLFAAPITELIGIESPALYFEAGLQKTTDWKYLVQPLVASMQKVIL